MTKRSLTSSSKFLTTKKSSAVAPKTSVLKLQKFRPNFRRQSPYSPKIVTSSPSSQRSLQHSQPQGTALPRASAI